MSNAISLQPLASYPPASIDRLTFEPLVSATVVSNSGASLLDSISSIVQLSAEGQVLARGTVLQASLEALQSNTISATPASVMTWVQDFVAAFNQVQQSIDTVVTFPGTGTDNPLVTQLSQTLNAAATTAAAGGQDLSALQAIGVTFVASSPADSTAASLTIDPAALDSAAQADPQGTATLLAQSTRALLQQVTLLEIQATRFNGWASDSSVSGTGLSTTVIPNPTPDTLAATVELPHPDPAAVGLNAASIQSTGTVLEAALAGSISTNILVAAAEVGSGSMSTAAVATVTPRTAADATPQTLVAVAPIATVASQNLPQSSVGTAIDTVPVAQGDFNATLILQNLMVDGALRDIIFNPAYPVFIATSHLIDFTAPTPQASTGAIPVDIPEAIMPINPVRAVSIDQ